MDWTELFISSLLGGGAVGAILLGALESRFRKVFATREDMNGLAKRMDESSAEIDRKVERNTTLYVKLDDRVGVVEEKALVLQERQTLQWDRISEQMSNTGDTLKEIVKEVKEVTRIQQDLAIRMERIHQNTPR